MFLGLATQHGRYLLVTRAYIIFNSVKFSSASRSNVSNVDLGGKNEEEVQVRAELVSKVVKAVVHCDVNRDPPIP